MNAFAQLARRLAPGSWRRLATLYDNVRWVGWLRSREHALLEFHQRQEFMRGAFRALEFNGITGDYAEFGCADCVTFRLAYEESRRSQLSCRLWAFDSFRGLPQPSGPTDAHPRWKEGDYKTSVEQFLLLCHRAGIPQRDFEIVPGFYQDTLNDERTGDPTCLADVAFAYIDCDLFSSTQAVLRFLRPRLKHGMILAFDDFYCYSATALAGERRALLEFASGEESFRFVPYMQFGWFGMSFVVEDSKLYGDMPLGPAAPLQPW